MQNPHQTLILTFNGVGANAPYTNPKPDPAKHSSPCAWANLCKWTSQATKTTPICTPQANSKAFEPPYLTLLSNFKLQATHSIH